MLPEWKEERDSEGREIFRTFLSLRGLAQRWDCPHPLIEELILEGEIPARKWESANRIVWLIPMNFVDDFEGDYYRGKADYEPKESDFFKLPWQKKAEIEKELKEIAESA